MTEQERQMTQRLAREVMGWKWLNLPCAEGWYPVDEDEDDPDPDHIQAVTWYPYAHLHAAMQVVERLTAFEGGEWDFILRRQARWLEPTAWGARFIPAEDRDRPLPWELGETAAEAICKAALHTLEKGGEAT